MSAAARYVLYLLLVAAAGFALYAGLADLPPPTRSMEVPAQTAPAGGGGG